MNGFEIDFKSAYDSYYNAEPGGRTSYEEAQRGMTDAAEACAAAILDSEPIEEIRKSRFVDYGTMNGWGWKTCFDFRVAKILHDHDAKTNPSLHDVKTIDTVYGWHETKCACGFGWSCDSSD